MNGQEVNVEVVALIDAWCERRALAALRHALRAWPHNGLTDGLAELRTALEDVRAFAKSQLHEDEGGRVSRVIAALDTLVRDR